jgi:hypothetical protein
MSADPLLQPYQLKNLRLRNRIIITAHEPAYPEDGMPKDLYRAYRVERAKAVPQRQRKSDVNIITTRRMTSGELLKYRNGLLMHRG